MFIYCPPCLCLQGPYDTAPMLHGCDCLEGGKTLLTLDAGVIFSFSRQFLLPPISSHRDHAISVQTPSGEILGCGRVEKCFAVNAMYKGRFVLSQHSPYLPTIVVDFFLLSFNVLEGISGTSVFDPWNAQLNEICNETTFDQIPVGKLTCRQKKWFYGQHFLFEVPLIGSATILGHMVCIILKHT